MSASNIYDVKSGDIIVLGSDSKGYNFLSYVVRFFTMSDFSHAGIAVWKDGELYMAEATMPKVKMSKLKITDRTYFIKTPITHDQIGREFIDKTIGLDYSVLDGVRAVLGMVSKKDDKWQCAEYIVEYLKLYGHNLGNANTPARLVRKAMSHFKSPLVKLIG